MRESLNRAIRTFLQAFLGVFLAQWGTVAATGAPAPEVYATLLVSAGLSGFIAVLSWLHNALEETSGKSVLKPKPVRVAPKRIHAVPPDAA